MKNVENELGDASYSQKATEMVLKIYDPAMCCSSGVCGPSVDPILAQFASALKEVSKHAGVRVERYNLGQQPQAFAANETVKDMLGNGGMEELPFIFINDVLWLKGRHPSKAELFDALNIKTSVLFTSFSAPQDDSACCADGGCC
ncbi:arsenite efflux transporter metallochaperone ArsD [Coraliomargarita sp. SDUM461003]|uniref:Arsenite efflux transporter metallochaperone ArsD n=1 Tax=Thalassobacterium maritimum TaxID=3041265 RepID=A0ABU1AYF3_9BACT|nr:arsenite efflux transporter metallochaperone ArsD [Coraliomargarita sp. SDUM461003]MDQ8209191.1 arsenite efflux transporter metallochaperone ArsD [Coraliomargarita sp. SDUM461003]